VHVGFSQLFIFTVLGVNALHQKIGKAVEAYMLGTYKKILQAPSVPKEAKLIERQSFYVWTVP
jgi:hypothetical protein